MMIDCLLADYGGQRPLPAGNSDGPPRPPSFTSPIPWPPTFRGVQGETTFRF
jgi:hypothetical protein